MPAASAPTVTAEPALTPRQVELLQRAFAMFFGVQFSPFEVKALEFTRRLVQSGRLTDATRLS